MAWCSRALPQTNNPTLSQFYYLYREGAEMQHVLVCQDLGHMGQEGMVGNSEELLLLLPREPVYLLARPCPKAKAAQLEPKSVLRLPAGASLPEAPKEEDRLRLTGLETVSPLSTQLYTAAVTRLEHHRGGQSPSQWRPPQSVRAPSLCSPPGPWSP